MGKELNIHSGLMLSLFKKPEQKGIFAEIISDMTDENVYIIKKLSKKWKTVLNILVESGYASINEDKLTISKELAFITYDTVIQWIKSN